MTQTTPSTSAQGTVAGWKLVPVEPTDEMLRASCAVDFPALYRLHLRHPDNGPATAAKTEDHAADAKSRYRAMLAAAPAPAASPPSPGEVMLRRSDAQLALTALDTLMGDTDPPEDTPALLACQALSASLASDATANSKAGDEDVRGALAKAVADEREAILRLVAGITDAQRTGWRDNPKTDGCGGSIAASNTGYFIEEAIRARTLATPETESRDGARNA